MVGDEEFFSELEGASRDEWEFRASMRRESSVRSKSKMELELEYSFERENEGGRFSKILACLEQTIDFEEGQ